jgi:putative ABC transport system permease protein
MIFDYFKLAWENITHRKLRSILTVVGIVIGIAAVVALVSLGQGVKKVITDEFAKAGVDKVIVSPAASFGAQLSTKPLTDNDIDTIKKINGVTEIAGMIYKTGRIESRKEITYSIILGLPLDKGQRLIEQSWNIEYVDGRPLRSGDNYKAVVAHELAKGKDFGRPLNVGDKVFIEGIEFEIVGKIKQMGDPGVDNALIIPQDVANDIFKTKQPDGTYEQSMIVARTDSTVDPADVARDIKKTLRRERNVKEGEEDFTVQTFSELVASFNTIIDVLSAVVIGIASISLFVGGVGIMNTMYTAVLQRTNEIGVMKAIGARNSQILTLFLLESGMLGMIGGIIGVIIGWMLSSFIAFIGRTFLDSQLLIAYFPWYLIVGALAFAFIVGMLSGITPALQASRQNPVDALRYE